MDLSNLDAASIATLIICGIIVIAAVIRFIIHIFDKKDK